MPKGIPSNPEQNKIKRQIANALKAAQPNISPAAIAAAQAVFDHRTKSNGPRLSRETTARLRSVLVKPRDRAVIVLTSSLKHKVYTAAGHQAVVNGMHKTLALVAAK